MERVDPSDLLMFTVALAFYVGGTLGIAMGLWDEAKVRTFKAELECARYGIKPYWLKGGE